MARNPALPAFADVLNVSFDIASTARLPPTSVTRGSYWPGPGVASASEATPWCVSCGSSRWVYLAPKPSEPWPAEDAAATLLCFPTLIASSCAIVLCTCELYDPGPTCACVVLSAPTPSRLSETK